MKLLAFILALGLGGALLFGAHAQTQAAAGGAYTLDWSVVGAGGGIASGGGYIVAGTIGEPTAGAASSDGYTLVGGFVAGVAVAAPVGLPPDRGSLSAEGSCLPPLCGRMRGRPRLDRRSLSSNQTAGTSRSG